MTAGSHSSALPSLGDGVTQLHRPAGRSLALPQLVVNDLLTGDGETFWVDTRETATTYALSDLAPSERTLRGVHIARAFTAYQHHTLVCKLVAQATPETNLLVVPEIDALYADDDVPEYEGEDLLTASLTILRELATSLGVRVLVTSAGTHLSQLVAAHADTEITCTETALGFHYEAPDFETLVYWGDGFWQTTIPYWVELFGTVDEFDPVIAAADNGWFDAEA
ncbi:hypothetical protein [Haladaptatus sp. DJG-WS-42]|uniref:hypothetical protein n=1 Tax=Haladaptatus sp. DJG-WS-42 TaxID=3120516 RepID=UPI0030CF1C9B